MKSNTPIIDFVKEYINSGNLRLHMPGHKGRSFLGCEACDITEFDGADVLYHADGIISESMQNASELFGTAKTLYSAEGSSLSIRAMMYLAVLYAKSCGKKPLIFAGRNAHKTFVTAAGLLDFDIKWLYGKSNGIAECMISKEQLETELSDADEKPVAVYITSPDYLGNIADIHGISQTCKKYGVLLLVDNAHGAYLNFLPENRHPIYLGADMCCDSAHKTLPALTGAGYLHISRNAPEEFCRNSGKAMSLFASTSPSYLILQSLDGLNKYLAEGYTRKLKNFCDRISVLKERLALDGISIYGDEPLKITLKPKKIGYTGTELAQYLKENGIVCEFYDPDYVVLMLTPENGDDITEKIYDVLSKLDKKAEITECPPSFENPKIAASVKETLFAQTEHLPIEKCRGRVFAGINAACPPAIPVAVCGELITESVIRMLEYYGENECEVTAVM